MNDIEFLLIPILILAYGVVCYICGKGDLLNVIALMLKDKAKELEKRLKETTYSEMTIDEKIEYWHTHDTGNSLREFLGMTEEEYLNFALGKTTTEEDGE